MGAAGAALLNDNINFNIYHMNPNKKESSACAWIRSITVYSICVFMQNELKSVDDSAVTK